VRSSSKNGALVGIADEPCASLDTAPLSGVCASHYVGVTSSRPLDRPASRIPDEGASDSPRVITRNIT
jgi:hypothetical protein